MDTVTNGEVELRVQVEGDGPPVLLLHGWPDSHRLWRHQVPALADAGYRVLAPDLRGFGESSRPLEVDAYRMQTLVTDVNAILDHYGIDRAHIVGHDWGAILAWAVAAFLPGRTQTLTVFSVGHPNAFFDAGFEQKEKSWYMWLFMYEGLAEEKLGADDFAMLRAFTDHHPEAGAWAADLAREGALTASLNWYRANVDPRLPPVSCPRVAAPTMGIWPSSDRYLIESQMIRSGDLVDGSFRYERIEGATHWAMLDQPELVNSLMLDFLRSQSA